MIEGLAEPSRRVDSDAPATLYPLAAWWRRGFGLLIDDVLVLLPAGLIFGVGSIVIALQYPNGYHPCSAGESPAGGGCTTEGNTLLIVAGVVAVACSIAYPVYFLGRRGRTPGMKRMGVRLFARRASGELEHPTYGTSRGRWAVATAIGAASLFLLGIPGIVNYLWAAFDRKHQCLHDKVARTVVVDERGMPPSAVPPARRGRGSSGTQPRNLVWPWAAGAASLLLVFFGTRLEASQLRSATTGAGASPSTPPSTFGSAQLLFPVEMPQLQTALDAVAGPVTWQPVAAAGGGVLERGLTPKGSCEIDVIETSPNSNLLTGPASVVCQYGTQPDEAAAASAYQVVVAQQLAGTEAESWVNTELAGVTSASTLATSDLANGGVQEFGDVSLLYSAAGIKIGRLTLTLKQDWPGQS